MPSLLISSPRKIIEDKNRGLKELTLGWLKLENMLIKPTETKIHSVQVFRESYGQDEPIVDEHQTFTKVKIAPVFLHKAFGVFFDPKTETVPFVKKEVSTAKCCLRLVLFI